MAYNSHPFRRWGHSAVSTPDSILVFGGHGASFTHQSDTRLNTISRFTHNSLANSTEFSLVETPVRVQGNIPCAREKHSAIYVEDQGVMVIFGGRTHPGNALDDLWSFDVKKEEWICRVNVNETRPKGRFRHATTLAKIEDETFMIVFGGKDAKEDFSDVWMLNLSTWKWKEIICSGDIPFPRHSASACVIQKNLYIYGGYAMDNSVFILSLDSFIWNCINTVDGPYRYSHQSFSINYEHKDFLIIFGGLSIEDPEFDSICIYDISNNCWRKSRLYIPTMLCKFAIGFLMDKIWIVGGGAHCFSFGTCFNPVYSVTIKKDIGLDFQVDRCVKFLPEVELKSIVNDVVETAFKCDKCGVCFASRNKLFGHIKNCK